MRTWFEPEEAEAFEAAKAVLLRRCLTWADEHDRPADELLIGAAIDARHHSRDGRLAYWDEKQIRRYLLGWIPRYVVAAREILDIAPDILRTYLGYLAATGLRDPRGATPAEADLAIARATPEYRAALAHLTRPGPLAFARDPAEPRAHLQPPIALPPAADLTAAAARSPTVERLIALTTWAGEDDRPLTETGDLPAGAARELTALLGTGEDAGDARSSADLPRLALLLAWAKRLRLVRSAGGRLHAVARTAPLLRDPEGLWRHAFHALPSLGPFVTRRTTASPFTLFFPDLLTGLLNTLYGMDDMPVARLAETAWLTCRKHHHRRPPGWDGPGWDGPGSDDKALDPRRKPADDPEETRQELTEDLTRTFDVLADLGAVELTRGPADELYLSGLDHDHDHDHGLGLGRDERLPPDAAERLRTRLAEPDLLLARLTPLGQRAVRERLLADGRDAPLIGELAGASAAELLGVLTQHYPPYDAAAELHGWLAQPGHGIEPLLQAVRECPFRTRAAAMLNILAETLPDGRALLHGLRRDPVLGPAALTYLVDVGELDPSAIGHGEHLLLVAENFLTLLELGGPRPLIEQLKAMAGREAYDLVAAVLEAGHHDTVGLEEMRVLVAEPLRAARHRPLRLIPGTGPGSRTRPTRKRNRRDH